MSAVRVHVTDEIRGEMEQVFEWFYHSENFTKSPIVFRSAWKKNSTKWKTGSIRDINMIAGWYEEEITDVKEKEYIRYRVVRSFPKVRQDFTEIRFQRLPSGLIQVDWVIEIEVPGRFSDSLSKSAGRMARTLYGTIIHAGRKEIERMSEETGLN